MVFKEISPAFVQAAPHTLGYDSPTGINAHAENIPLAGPLQGLFIDEAHLNQTGYGATISRWQRHHRRVGVASASIARRSSPSTASPG